MDQAAILAQLVGVVAACAAFELARASFYRARRPAWPGSPPSAGNPSLLEDWPWARAPRYWRCCTRSALPT
jgi:hypothetical protein